MKPSNVSGFCATILMISTVVSNRSFTIANNIFKNSSLAFHLISIRHKMIRRQNIRLVSTFSSRKPVAEVGSSVPTKYYHGPVINRFEGRTHLDDVEDAVNTALLHFQPQMQQETAMKGVNRMESDSNECENVMQHEGRMILNTPQYILSFPAEDRECISVASNLKRRLDNFKRSGVNCRRCWLQKKHCVCSFCPPLEPYIDGLGRLEDEQKTESCVGIPNVNRLFLLTHHKEICLAVDTAKLIVSSFPTTSRLVVSGIGRDFQPAMGEMMDAVSNAVEKKNNASKCLILFPTEDAKTFADITSAIHDDESIDEAEANIDDGWDVIVIDGTWVQARKMHAKYFAGFSGGSLYRVQLNSDAVKVLDGNNVNVREECDGSGGEYSEEIVRGHQLRRHPIKWREISTLEATRLLLEDMHTNVFHKLSKAMAKYHDIGNEHAIRQLGPLRS
mmetsp:Transcript_3395/g.7195  ORF Transcript_3395/g.7195 Transcript_3395/m.7195 type:complete len:447 (-) Transcript_3395:242-1582(-)